MKPECAPTWHDRVIAALPVRGLTLLVGSDAQTRYLPLTKGQSLTERAAGLQAQLPSYFPLPHPSWRSAGWMKHNPWFEANLLPVLKHDVRPGA